MAGYDKCPSCGNRQRGDEVYKCRGCGKVMCSKCGDSKFGDVCPRCDGACPKVGDIG
jgi:hypothetical protein